ncbi:MAG TPA: sialidase family protein [Polyangiales bacterium]|nr:sialidase family protein [Polyangiales bacterium]
MNRAIYNTVTFAFVCALGACGSDKSVQMDTPATTVPPPTAAAGGTATASASGAPSTVTATAGMTAAPRAGAPATPKAGSPAPVTAGSAAGMPAPAGAGAGAGAPATPADAGPPEASGPTELPREPTHVDVTNDTKRRFGAPHVAVNPKDPNNIVVLASSNLGYTRTCVPAPVGSDCEMIPAGNPLLTQPRGFYKTPGFMDIGVYASFDRGKTFERVDVSKLVPPGHPEVNARGEGPIAALADGTFYVGFNAINWGQWESQPTTFFPNGGVGVIKSTDGGKTWNWVSYSHTPADWPYGGSDLVTGTFYVTSGLAGLSTLGPRSTGLADSPEGTIADRWISSTKDGTTWTDPQALGGENGASHVTAGHSSVAAAHGIMATMFVSSDSASCRFFLGSMAPANCVVFQTSKDAGVTWARHRVPAPAGFRAAALSLLLGADPKKEGHFIAVLLSESGSDILAFQTADSGNTWSEPVKLTTDPTKTKFAPWVASSPGGEFGVMWRTYEPDPAKPRASAPYMPYSVWAVVTKDGGATFSRPLQISHANSPAPPDDPDDAFSFIGDHGPSGMALDDRGGAYVVWADWTSGERSISFSAVDVKAFEF